MLKKRKMFTILHLSRSINLYDVCMVDTADETAVFRHYTVSQKKLGHFFTAYNFRNIEQIFTKFGTNQSLFILNIVPEFN